VNLCCSVLDSAGWKYLSNIPAVLTLKINGLGVDNLLDRGSLNFVPFLNLTALCFEFDTRAAANIATVIQQSEFPSLNEFDLQPVCPWRRAEQLFHALSQRKACQTLDHVKNVLPQAQVGVGMPLPVIGQSLWFTQLRHLWLHVEGLINLDNDRLFEAVSSRPHIELLKVDHFYGGPTVTFRRLFAAHFLRPRLHTPHIFMDVENIPKKSHFNTSLYVTQNSVPLA